MRETEREEDDDSELDELTLEEDDEAVGESSPDSEPEV